MILLEYINLLILDVIFLRPIPNLFLNLYLPVYSILPPKIPILPACPLCLSLVNGGANFLVKEDSLALHIFNDKKDLRTMKLSRLTELTLLKTFAENFDNVKNNMRLAFLY